MKKTLLLFVVFATSAFTLFAQPIYNEDGIRLYHTPSQEEIDWAISKGLMVEPKAPTAPPPVGELRPIAEFEPMEAVLIRYPFGIPMSLIKEMAKDIKVITIVANTSEQSTVLSQYNSNGVNTANCKFLIAPTNTYWTRDYGPWFMAIDNQDVAMFDFTYNRPARPLDNQINGQLVTFLSNDGIKLIERYVSPLQLTGGNFMNDGISQATSTTLTLTENSGYTTQQIKDHFLEYMGIEQYHFITDPIVPYDNIQHIDCWSKLLAPDKVLVVQVPSNNPNYSKFEAAADYFASLTSSYGTPMQVFRVNGNTSSSPLTPYTNSLILNNKVFVPINATTNANDLAALQVYEEAMPGYEIIGINYSGWLNTDALHCRTHEIADRCMLYIKHQPLFGEIENTGVVTFSTELYSYCNNTVYSDSVLIYLKHSGGAYQKYNMTYQGDNIWEVTVGGLPSGLIEYYVFAADESGRRECHPYIGASDPHKFILTGASPDLPVLVIDKTSSSVTSEGFAVVEDLITVSNAGNANLTFEITDVNFPEMLTIAPLSSVVQPDGSQVITLSYDFANVESGEYVGSFKLLSNDPLNQIIEISLHAYQNIPMLSLDKTSSSVTLNGITTIEDYITASNIGNADLEFEIADIDFPAKLTVTPFNGTIQPGGSQIITLTYEFDYAKNLEYTGNFKILSNDPKNPEVEISLYATIVTGINEWTMDNGELKIYPNPTKGELWVDCRDAWPCVSTIANIEIFDVLGRKVQSLTFNVQSSEFLNFKPEKFPSFGGAGVVINISNLPSGIYFMRITTENGIVTKKVIKN
jgi:agmatine/peptidylarginine deiminase